jgi:SAM-dependent methyltransferase
MERGDEVIVHLPALPWVPTAFGRFDELHRVLRSVMGGNHLAPLVEPGSILDVGCGTGQWAYEMCDEFPEARVVGIDLRPCKPSARSSYRFVKANLLQGLPFLDGTFGYVHQRLLMSGVPMDSWPAAVAELARVTRPGGWLELHETAPGMEPEGPATRRLYDWLRELGRAAGTDTMGYILGSLDRMLAATGARPKRDETLEVPVGGWAGPLGETVAASFASLFTGLTKTFEARFGLPESECLSLVEAMLAEFEELQPIIYSRVVVGQRPG